LEKPSDKLVVVVVCILIIVISYGSYVNSSKVKGFEIYLTQEDIPPAQMEALSHVELIDHPIISVKDIITYNAQTHEIKLTSNAYDRVLTLDVPVTGRSFMVCVDEEPIYWGAFWTPISSLSFDGVTIWQPYNTEEQKIIVLELGYPSSSYYSDEDPRNNRKVLESLEKDGKLITKLSLTLVDKLPHSMKGYELYSWEDIDQWHFTIITGTNRVKTVEEITSEEDFISETGWVNIHVVGVEAVKDVLIKLPQGESVFWCDELHIGQTMEHTDLRLPPKSMLDVILEHANSSGIELVITVS
jgi:hypothetical protein